MKHTIAVQFVICAGILLIQWNVEGETRFKHYRVLKNKTLQQVVSYVGERLKLGDDITVEILP